MEAREDGADLRRRIESLERRCRRQTTGIAAILAACGLGFAAQSADEESLTLRELVIVDARGTPRVRIAAPLPDPIMLGKRFQRGDPVSGILIYDDEGNERGGYVTGDGTRSAALTLDEINRAAIHLGVSERGEAHVMLSNGQGSSAAMGVVPDGGYLRLERGGQAVTTLPAAAPAESGK